MTCVDALRNMSITVTPTIPFSSTGISSLSVIFLCLAFVAPTSSSVTRTATGATLPAFTGAAAVKKVAAGALGIAGAIAGVLL